MNVVNPKLLMCAATMLTLSLLCFEQPALAQSNCREAKGTLVEVFTAGAFTSGDLSNAGWLNGTTHIVFTGPVINPLPTIFMFEGQFVVTTSLGQLKASNLRLLDVATLKGNALGYIDPNGSTGIFAGATGTLYLNLIKITIAGSTQTFEAEVNGQVCFAKQ